MSRLDQELVERGLALSRSKAQRLIRQGSVTVDGVITVKPSTTVGNTAMITIAPDDDYVSRGAYKLVGAFEAFSSQGLSRPDGVNCLDIGASTGGFTDVLLRFGAAHVVALDVGHGQLDSRIASDSRVIEMSGVNIRDVRPEDLPFTPRMIVSDVSFISLTYVIPVISTIVGPQTDIVLLVKPQFEVGRGNLGKNGIVESESLRRGALDRVVACAREHGLRVMATADSPIEGTHGNHEYLLWLQAGTSANEDMADTASAAA